MTNQQQENTLFYAKVSIPIDYSIPISGFSAVIIDESTLIETVVPGVFVEFGIGLYGIEMSLPIGVYIIRIINSEIFNSIVNIPIQILPKDLTNISTDVDSIISLINAGVPIDQTELVSAIQSVKVLI